jgi:hypothetical protein
VKSERALRELAQQHGIKTTQRRFFECRDDHGQIETKFIDLPRPRSQIADELRERGLLPPVS